MAWSGGRGNAANCIRQTPMRQPQGLIDNNTLQPAVWRPVQEHCERLGARFQFFHVEALSGYKAGALNYALGKTTADATIVAMGPGVVSRMCWS